ncbi:unnamed protein product [Trichogramma brassicae]|uniref:Uncharacterized protein n=1 Tax=Trichogramma brassicae TaxID=86971 RepID=A0A6H5J1D3_9HYME|nr:unnamed protein product [Trichogramma brassicae]
MKKKKMNKQAAAAHHVEIQTIKWIKATLCIRQQEKTKRRGWRSAARDYPVLFAPPPNPQKSHPDQIIVPIIDATCKVNSYINVNDDRSHKRASFSRYILREPGATYEDVNGRSKTPKGTREGDAIARPISIILCKEVHSATYTVCAYACILRSAYRFLSSNFSISSTDGVWSIPASGRKTVRLAAYAMYGHIRPRREGVRLQQQKQHTTSSSNESSSSGIDKTRSRDSGGSTKAFPAAEAISKGCCWLLLLHTGA